MVVKTIRLLEQTKGAGTCRSCGARLDWYDTLKGRKMPMNAGAVPLRSENDPGTGQVVAFFDAGDNHWLSCPDADRFR